MSYRDEFLAKLASHLGIRSTAQIPAFVERMHAQGTPKATCNEFRKFANSLEKLSRREAAPGKAIVGKIEFLRYLRQGEGLVQSITEEVDQA